MREIKFRVWYTDWGTLNRMDYDEVFFVDESGIRLFNEVDSKTIIMQFTGLKDKNGKEIYEGDIIAYEEDDSDLGSEGRTDFEKHYMVVEFDATSAYNVGDQNMGGPDGVIKMINIEVIGNIYENPELIPKE